MSRRKHGGGRRRAALEHEEPFRSCAACRASRPRHEMLRFARSPDGAVGFDVRARLEGRGVWTCARAMCLRRAVDKAAFERAFDAPVLVQPDPLAAAVRAALWGEAAAGLGLLRRAARLAAGREDVRRALSDGRVVAVVLASDLSERTRREVEALAGELLVVSGPGQVAIGNAIGRKPTGVLGVLGGPRAELLLSDLRRAASFDEQRTGPSAPPSHGPGGDPDGPERSP